MRNFNQATLDQHLASLAQNLTPDQAARVKERVRQKLTGGSFDLTPDAVDGAFALIGHLVRARISIPGGGGAGAKVSGVINALSAHDLPGAGQAAETVSGMLGGLGKLLGSSGSAAGSAFGGLSKLLGSASSAGGDALGAVGDLAGNAGAVTDLLGAALEAAPDAGDLAGFILEAIGEVLSSS